ncbi:SH3 domain-containing protein [Oleomonas cavernae]|nr:SH3 domain-containing protein [Oleomonas cavernae]
MAPTAEPSPAASTIEQSRAGLDLVLAPPQQPAPAVASGPLVAVDSRAGDNTYPIWLWTISNGGAVGAIDKSHVEGGVVTLSGWAGDINLGLRMSDVLLVACDRVVASVPVSGTRADIARKHPNLPAAGWSARLALADLAPCDHPVVSAYATALFGSAAFPLSGEVEPGDALLSAEALRLDRPTAELRTPRTAQAPIREVEVGGQGIALRRCGKRECAVVARLPAGHQRLLILDDQAGWILVAQSSGTAGWAPASALKVPTTDN